MNKDPYRITWFEWVFIAIASMVMILWGTSRLVPVKIFPLFFIEIGYMLIGFLFGNYLGDS